MQANRRIRRFVSLLWVALHTFSGAAATDNTLGAQYDGTNFLATLKTEGNVFEVRALTQPVSVTRFDINIDAGTDTIEVRSRPGIQGTVVTPGSPGMTIEELGKIQTWSWPEFATHH